MDRAFGSVRMLVEMLCGLGLAGLYYWEIGMFALFPADMPRPPNPALPPNLPFILHEQYIAHAVLIWLMLVASLIDVDEKIIPDAITRPGTLVGLFLAAVWPWSLLPDVYMQVPGKWNFKFLCVTSPNSWPAWLDGAPNCRSLAIALACWAVWCLAILPRTWYAPRLAKGLGPVLDPSCPPGRHLPNIVHGRAWGAADRGRLEPWRRQLEGAFKRIGRHGRRRRNYLDRSRNRPGRARSRGHGFRRRYIDGHDRGVSGLADLSDRVFPIPFCRAGRGLVAIFSHPRQGNPLRPVSMPGCTGCDYITGPRSGTGPRASSPWAGLWPWPCWPAWRLWPRFCFCCGQSPMLFTPGGDKCRTRRADSLTRYVRSTPISAISLFLGAGQQVVETFYITIVDVGEVLSDRFGLIGICPEQFDYVAFVACATGGEL